MHIMQVLWQESSQRMNNWWGTKGKESGFTDIDYKKTTPIIVVTGTKQYFLVSVCMCVCEREFYRTAKQLDTIFLLCKVPAL